MPGGRKWLRRAALLLALGAGGVAASTPAPVSPGSAWKADPDDQFLLDVNIRQLRLGEGVRAYNTPEGTCVVLGDFLAALDVPVKIDLQAKKATGWAFKESRRIAIDYAAMTASYGGKSEPIGDGTIRFGDEGQPGILGLALTGSLVHPPGPGGLTGSINVLDTTVKDLRLGPLHLTVDRLNLGSIEDVQVAFDGFRPIGLTATIHRITGTNLSMLIGPT